jgi:hypothetical protein
VSVSIAATTRYESSDSVATPGLIHTVVALGSEGSDRSLRSAG